MKTYKPKKPAYEEIDNVHELCRLCLEKAQDNVAIFKDEKDLCAAVALRIMICVGLEIKYELSLPNTICKTCYEELENYYKFRKRCQLSYQKLKSHAMAVKSKSKSNLKIMFPVRNIPVSEIVEGCGADNVKEDEINGEKQIPQTEEQRSGILELITENPVEIEEVQLPTPSEASPDIGTFLSTILTELGILGQEQGLLQYRGVTSLELETGDGNEMELELVEENDAVEIPEELSAQDSVNTEDVEEIKPCSDKEDNNNMHDFCLKKRKTSRPWCSQCGRSFSSRSALTRHTRAHSGARPHACACGQTFTQKAVLHRHMLVHLDVRPHRCSLCNKSFTQRLALAAHARAHAPPHARALALHRCTACHKVFLYASGLSRHMMTHLGRVYECSACDKHFKDRSSLLRHLKTVCQKGRGKNSGAISTADRTSDVCDSTGEETAEI